MKLKSKDMRREKKTRKTSIVLSLILSWTSTQSLRMNLRVISFCTCRSWQRKRSSCKWEILRHSLLIQSSQSSSSLLDLVLPPLLCSRMEKLCLWPHFSMSSLNKWYWTTNQDNHLWPNRLRLLSLTILWVKTQLDLNLKVIGWLSRTHQIQKTYLLRLLLTMKRSSRTP